MPVHVTFKFRNVNVARKTESRSEMYKSNSPRKETIKIEMFLASRRFYSEMMRFCYRTDLSRVYTSRDYACTLFLSTCKTNTGLQHCGGRKKGWSLVESSGYIRLETLFWTLFMIYILVDLPSL